ncbi:DUF4031 domain-containing protein [Streptosporangium longisporum]|uniref:DUF4031 domain-containing protein n=1 Tax=Streptosporangium longisporum TaxID=46187 RepID=UPI003CD05AAA
MRDETLATTRWRPCRPGRWGALAPRQGGERPHRTRPQWPGYAGGWLWSHLVSDTSVEELHAPVAETLGVPRRALDATTTTSPRTVLGARRRGDSAPLRRCLPRARRPAVPRGAVSACRRRVGTQP